VADSLDALEGNYNGTPSNPVTVLAGIRKRFVKSKVVYVQGSGLIGPVTNPVPGSALYTDDTKKQHGLKTEYFSNVTLDGSLEQMLLAGGSAFSAGMAVALAKAGE